MHSTFTIGYLNDGCDLAEAAEGETREAVAQLREHLLADADFAAALSDAGFSDIMLRPCDGPYDMIQRLGVQEFELAFATSVIYGRLFLVNDFVGADAPATGYDPALQFRFTGPHGDIETPSGSMRRGVLFRDPMVTELDSAESVMSKRWAVSNAYAAGGYIYPFLELRRRYPDAKLQPPLFCGSEDAAIKHVVAGLTSVGATEHRRLNLALDLLPNRQGEPPLIEVFQTDPYPTDPILLHRQFMPRERNAKLGRKLISLLTDHFNDQQGLAGIRVNKAQRRAYELMARALREFDQLTRTRSATEADKP